MALQRLLSIPGFGFKLRSALLLTNGCRRTSSGGGGGDIGCYQLAPLVLNKCNCFCEVARQLMTHQQARTLWDIGLSRGQDEGAVLSLMLSMKCFSGG